MAGISTNRTNIELPIDVSTEIIQKTQEESAVMRLSRSVDLPGRGMTIPMITGDPEANWVSETAAKPVSNPELDKKIMTPYKLAVIVPFSDEFRRDYSRLYNALVDRIPNVLGKKFDATVFNGTAPGTGFDVLTNVTAQSISGDGGVYGALVAADIDIASNDGDISGFALSPQARGELLSALDGNERPIFINSVADGAVPRLLGQPVTYTKGLYFAGNTTKPDVIGFAGDWSKAWYGTVEGVKIDMSDQATLTINNAQVNLWEHNMFAVKAEIEVGFIADTTVFNKLTRTHV